MPAVRSLDPADLLALAVQLTRQAGELVLRGREDAIGDFDTKSTPTDVVTEMDKAAERQIIEGLLAQRPDDGILGEEGGERRGTSGVRWLVDPIDGTVNYLYGIPAYGVSIAAEQDGTVVAGAVYSPAMDELWTATRGGGAWLGDRRLSGSAVTALGQTMLATGFGYDSEQRARQAEVVRALLPEVRDIRRFGAASLDLCFAALGRVDAYFEQGLSPWDLGAGALIAEEAGLVVSGLRGAPVGRDLVLAAPPSIHQVLHDRLVELDADR